MRKESANGMMKNGITDPNKDSLINTVRPIRSDKIPKMMRPIINPIIVNDKVRLASDGDTENSFTNTGRSGCTAFMAAKVKNNTLPRNWVIFYFCSHVCCTATSACICERIFCIPIGSESHFIINYYRVDYWSHHLRNFIRSYGTDSIYQAIFVRIRYPIFHHAISRLFSHFTRTSSSTRVRFSWTSSCLAGLY